MQTPKLTYNLDKETGEIEFPLTWEHSDYVWKRDVLRDWLTALQAEYEQLDEEDKVEWDQKMGEQKTV